MKIELFDFQKDALHNLREKLVIARPHASSENPQAISFSAPTGSGKTVIMTALFEAILDAPDEQLNWPVDWKAQPDAVILWVSDMPELNEQTRKKIEGQSDKIYRVTQLETIESEFDQERLDGGKIYFVNTQKLANDKILTRSGDDRGYSLWETLTNTASAIPDRFYVVIDEAHRGMSGSKNAGQAQSIVQRLIKGHKESGLSRMPLIVGVSATPKRFNDLLADTTHTVHKVHVPPEDVRESGLLKDRILIHHPDHSTKAELGLLREASSRWADITSSWAEYCQDEGERVVKPIIVVQVEDGTGSQLTRTNLVDALRTMEKAIGRKFADSELAHAFQDTADYLVEEQTIRKIDASRIEEDPMISVVFFKMALSTGWDCPRAEVMMSFRRAEDHTYIAQLLGRMVRTPLARRIDRLAELNDVHLFLPYFDRKAVKAVIKALESSEDVPPSEVAGADELVILRRNSAHEDVFRAIEALVTYRVNAHRVQSDIRRYQALARQLTIDEIAPEAWDKAKKDAVGWIEDEVAVLAKSGQLAEASKELANVELNRIAVNSMTGASEVEGGYVVPASEMDIERQFHEAGRALGNGLHADYWRAHADRNATDVKLELIALTHSKAGISALERKSRKAFDSFYDRYRSKFYKQSETKIAVYERLRSASTDPSEIPWRLPDTVNFRRDPSDPVWEKHLYVEEDGSFRIELGDWEEGVLREELGKADTVAWLRNLDRKPWSLEIPYESGGKAKPMFPDMLIVRQGDEGYIFDVLEPHDSSRADNVEKAKGLARFAEKHGALFGRIQLIRKGKSNHDGSDFARLDFNRSEIRDKVHLITSPAQLNAIFDEHA